MAKVHDIAYFHTGIMFRQTAADCGFVEIKNEPGVFFDPSDQSKWISKELYDFGWGAEKGFVRLPELEFEELWCLLWNSKLQNNVYGAATELMRKFPDQLLLRLEKAIEEDARELAVRSSELSGVLHFEKPMNLSTTTGKTFQEIDSDFNRWKHVAQKFTAARPLFSSP